MFVKGIVYRADGSEKGRFIVPSEADLAAQADAAAGETYEIDNTPAARPALPSGTPETP